ncbi:MAG: hypothetical protein CM15mP83_0440 [Flavobacteriaceae bacterium]|nr:MAG: hypothetical protein CM15mP83_0440 [Flavobacteriaceae bacterium]
MSYTELANNLPIYTAEKQQTIVNSSVLDWMHESQRHAKQIYGSITQDESLGYALPKRVFSACSPSPSQKEVCDWLNCSMTSLTTSTQPIFLSALH